MDRKKYNISPFVKWAGGKRQLLGEIEKRLPPQYNNYFEPFIGGGAVLFKLQPENATISDSNSYLINAYETIRDNKQELIDLLEDWDNKICDINRYYEMREKFNEKIRDNKHDVEAAALLIFLNKRCYNGLYRVNSKGFFNVPFNNKTNTKSISKENIMELSDYLKNVDISCCDFEEGISKAKKGDFIFFDSPYAPINPTSFESYTKEGFDIESHKRLSDIFKKLHKKGCYLMLTNHNTPFINDLYKGFNIDVVQVNRIINRKADNRKGEEVIITNYVHQ